MAEELGADAGAGLKALGVNCTLKRSPERSHTEALMNRVLGLLAEHGVETDILRPVDFASSSASARTRATATSGRRSWRRSRPPTSC